MLASSGEITKPCPVPLSLTVTAPSSRTPALSHFWIRRMMRRSPIRCSRKADEPFLADFSEERSDIGVQYVVPLGAGDADHQCVQRIVLAALGSKSVREPKELLLVDRVQHRDGRPLDDLVLKGGYR